MEYAFAVVAVLVFAGFIAHRVRQSRKDRGTGGSFSGGGTGRRYEEK